MEKICEMCNKVFTKKRNRSLSSWQLARFCSQKCRGLLTGRNSPNWKGERPTKQCNQCQKLFTRPTDYSNEMWLNRKYCSRSCSVINSIGHNVSNETREKIKKANTGKTASQKTRKKMSISKMGSIPWNKGTKGIMVSWNKGKAGLFNHTQEWKENLSQRMKGNQYKVGLSSWNKGLGGYKSGELNANWKGGVSKTNKTERQLAMETVEYKLWRKTVFERDNYICVKCKRRGIKLEADHIRPWLVFPELRYDINNGRTLCKSCHKIVGWSLFREANPMLEVMNNI